MMKKWYFSALGFLCFFFIQATVSWAQCPMCKAAVENREGAANSPLSSGLNTGILYLFVLPYLCVGSIGLVVWLNYRKNKQLAKAAAPDA